MASAKRERKNSKFAQKHPQLPANLVKGKSRTAWALEKRSKKN